MTSTVSTNTLALTRGVEQAWFVNSTGQPKSSALQARIDAYRNNYTLPTATKAAAEALINDFIADMVQAPEDSHAVADFIAKGLETNSTFAFLALIAYGCDQEVAYAFIEAIHDYAAAHGPRELADVSEAILPIHEHSTDEDKAQDFANFWGTVHRYGVAVVVAEEAVGPAEESSQTPLSGLDAVLEFAQTSGPIVYRHIRHPSAILAASSSDAITITDSTTSASDDYPVTEKPGSAVIVGVVAAEAVEGEGEEEVEAVEVAAIVVKGAEDVVVESQEDIIVVPVAVKDAGTRAPVADVPAWLDAVRPGSFESLPADPRPYADMTQMNTIAFPTMDGDAESVMDLVVEYPEAEGWPNYFALKHHAEQQQQRRSEEDEEQMMEEEEMLEEPVRQNKKKNVFRRTTSYLKKKAARVFGKRTVTSA